MTATGINVAAWQSATGSYVSVSVNQVSVSNPGTLTDSFKQKLSAASAGYGNRVQDDAVKTDGTTKTEYSKEQVKASAANEPKTGQTAEAEKSSPEDSNGKVTAKEDQTAANGNVKAEQDQTTSGTPAKVEESTAAEPQETIDTEELKTAFEILATLIGQMAQILQTSMEELQTKIDELQMIPSDLTENNQITKLVLNMNGGSDLSDLLVNQDLLDSLNSIKDMIAQVLETAGMTADEFKTVTADEIFTGMLEANDITAEIKPEELIITKDTGKVNVDENIQENEGFEVEITKTGFEDETRTDSSSANTESEGDEAETSLTSVKTEKDVKQNRRSETSPAERFVAGLENVMKADTIEVPGTTGRIAVRDIAFQLIDAVKVQISPDNTSLEMNLNPESLGKVSLNITSKDGVMTAQITTQNEVSKEALESQLQILKDNIEAQGVRVEAIEVTVAAYTFADSKNAESGAKEGQQDGTKHRGRGIEVADGGLTATEQEAERIRQEMMEQTGSTVTYVA